ncbi:MAG: tyrosine-type recombinase/integrase, partial [Desulfosalsimonadaceae bacterium]
KTAAGIQKGKGIHTLRHCFATHLLEAGTDIYTIKEFMGHRSIETTMVYLHILPNRMAEIKSPLDHFK